MTGRVPGIECVLYIICSLYMCSLSLSDACLDAFLEYKNVFSTECVLIQYVL
jgi:hypothetical protein